MGACEFVFFCLAASIQPFSSLPVLVVVEHRDAAAAVCHQWNIWSGLTPQANRTHIHCHIRRQCQIHVFLRL